MSLSMRFQAYAASIALGALMAACAGIPGPSAVGPPKVGQRFQDFTRPDLQGRSASLSTFRGKPIMVNYWATWCPPCRAEMPEIVRLYEAHKHQGFTVIGVNLQDDEEAAADFVQKFKMTFPVVVDSDSSLARELKVVGMPTTFFVRRDGNLHYQHTGLMSPSLIEGKVLELLQAD